MTTPEEKKKQTVVVGPNFLNSWFIYDFELCADREELKQTMAEINRHGYDLISVTQDLAGMYTVSFKRRACG